MRAPQPSVLASLCLLGLASATPLQAQEAAPDAVVQERCGVPVMPAKTRLTPAEIAALARGGPPPAAKSTVLYGDPTKAGLYTVMLSVPANTRLPPHTHRDTRTTVMVSGTWYFGYGGKFDESQLKALPPGSLYSEPACTPHFAMTRSEPAVVYVTGWGPSDTVEVDAPPP